MRFTRLGFVLAMCLATLPLLASKDIAVVEIGHHELNPPEITIERGQVVVFVNRVHMPGGHSLVADDGSFTSPPLEKNQSWSHAFERVGTVAYHVGEHPGNRGIVYVK